MKHSIRQFLFGTSLHNNITLNIGWLLFRLHIGFSLAIGAGFPKIKDLGAPGWFAEQVAGLGFTFPSPAFWATMASWGEFVGGICIALGLLTRFNALQLAFQFFVISFLWYENPEPITGMYFQNTLFMCYVLAAFAGGGKYSVDYFIYNRKKTIAAMPVKTAITTAILLLCMQTFAQNGPLNGSGNIVTKTFDYNNFDKLELLDLAGNISVEIGKPFSVNINIDDNLAPLLAVKQNNGELQIKLDGNNNNRLYVEATNIKINITMPEASVIQHRSNSSLTVSGVAGRYFRMNNGGNGNVIIKGSIDELDIVCRGNGSVRADDLLAKTIKIKKSGNGNVFIKTDNSFTANGSGNGDVVNRGNGVAAGNSNISGNGTIKYSKRPQPKMDVIKKVTVKIINETVGKVTLTVKYPVKGSYGIDIKPGETVSEIFPAGTKLFKAGQVSALKKPMYVVMEDSVQTFTIKP
jgi:uncharacterized membrane protein YphA (DoxX/SURF4 family)